MLVFIPALLPAWQPPPSASSVGAIVRLAVRPGLSDQGPIGTEKVELVGDADDERTPALQDGTVGRHAVPTMAWASRTMACRWPSSLKLSA